MALLRIHPTAVGVTDDWTASSGTKVDAVADDDGDTTYITSSTTAKVQEFTFPATAVPTGNMVMAVRIVAHARTTGGARLKLSLRRGVTSSYRRSDAPRDSSFALTTSYADYAIILPNVPFTTDGCPAMTRTTAGKGAWPSDGTRYDDFCFGVSLAENTSGEVRVTEFYLEVIYRPEVSMDDILSGGERVQLWQWAEIEGIRWVPSTMALPKGCGDYYYGFDRRPVAGSMLVNEMFRSGRINRAKGREEIETARFCLIDVTSTQWEATSPLTVWPQGFFSWLFASGDTTHVARVRMVTSAWNTREGLDPKGATYGWGFHVEAGHGSEFPVAGGEDSYLYVDRETLWYNEGTDTYYGNNTDALALYRGQFGSMNSLHEYNATTEIYPEVTDKPTSWEGRWVKIWTNAIDPITGYPFPMATAMARGYLWKSTKEERGPSKNQYTVLCSALDGLLDGKLPALRDARTRRINLHYAKVWVSWVDPTSGADKTTTFGWTNVDASFKDVAEVCAELNKKAGALSGTGAFNYYAVAFSYIGGKCRFSVYDIAGCSFEMTMSYQLAVVLGFNEEDSWISPDDGTQAVFTAPNSPASVFVEHYRRIYVEDDDTDDWPSTVKIAGTKTDQVVLTVSGGSGDPAIFAGNTTLFLSSDATGDYVQGEAQVPSVLRPFVALPIPYLYSAKGESPPTIRPGIVANGVRLHEFFLRAMLSTGFGTNNSTYDVWPLGFGLGISQDLVDVASWKSVSEFLKSKYTWFVLEPTALSEYLDEELALPNGVILRQDDEGRLQLQLDTMPVESDTIPSILEEHWVRKTTLVQEKSDKNIVNHVVLELDFDPVEEKYMTKLEAKEPNSIAKYGYKSLKLKHRGYRSRDLAYGASASTNPYSWFQDRCTDLFDRFAFEMPTVSGKLTPRALALKPGDGVRFSISCLQDILDDSTRGIVTKSAEVTKLDKNDLKGEVDVELQYCGVKKRLGGYAPAAVISSWSAGPPMVATCYANRLSDSSNGDTDVDFFSVGDAAILFQGNSKTPSTAKVTISAVGTNTLTVTGTVGFTPAAGDVIKWAAYDDLTTSQKAKGYVAVSDGGYVDSGNTVEGWKYSG